MNKLRSILLVDDDDATNFINKLMIDKLAVTEELYVARNGKEAVTMLQQISTGSGNGNQLPNLILLDINMPVLDGFGFMEAFDKMDLPEKGSTVIAVLTTSLNPKDMERMRALGIADFLNKPLTRDTLQNLIQKHYA